VSENISTQPAPAFLAPAMTQSYADIAQQQPPLLGHADIIARGRNMERQVIIDKAPNVTMNGMMNLTEKELVTKANLMIKMMNDDSMLRGTTFVGATKLKNGGTILQLNSKDVVDWLHGEDTANTFLGQLGGTSTMKTHPLNTVVEFIPITFNHDAFGAFREVKKASGLPQGSITSTRYFKPPHRRTPQQKNAHAISASPHVKRQTMQLNMAFLWSPNRSRYANSIRNQNNA